MNEIKRGRKPNYKMKSTIVQLVSSGLSFSDIARQFKISKQAIAYNYHSLVDKSARQNKDKRLY